MSTETKDKATAGGALYINKWHGIPCIADELGESIRHEVCLCWRCVRLVTEEDVQYLAPDLPSARIDELKAAFNCPTAEANYRNCVRGEVAAPITRCPLFRAGRIEYAADAERRLQAEHLGLSLDEEEEEQ